MIQSRRRNGSGTGFEVARLPCAERLAAIRHKVSYLDAVAEPCEAVREELYMHDREERKDREDGDQKSCL